MAKWSMEGPARAVVAMIHQPDHTLPAEIMRLDDASAAIVIEIDGVDYILTMARVPVQRPRPQSN